MVKVPRQRRSARSFCARLLVCHGAADLACGRGCTLGRSASVRQQDPTASFRGGVDFVSVDVTVTDQQGRPVRDLGLADFEVFEDGRRQKVSSFSLVQIPIVLGVATAKSGGIERVEPDVRSNERDASGRVYVLLLDDLHVSVLRSGLVKTAARQFVERHLGPHDVAAVLHTSGRADASQEFTRNPRLLLGAIDKFAGRKLRSAVLEKLDVYMQRNPDESTRADMRMERIEDPLSITRADQARSMLATLTGLGDMLSGSPGQRKAVVLFSEGLDYELQMSAAQTPSGLTTQTNTEAPTLRRELEQVIRASARANVSVYAVDPRGLAATGEDLIEVTSLPQNPLLGLTTTAFVDEVKAAQDSLRALSEQTGGFASVSSNDFGGAFERLVADNSMYYLLGYHSSDPKQDGRFRKIEVRVNRPSIRVRARSGYTAAPAKRIESRILTEALEPSPTLREALNGPLPVAGLPLRVFAAPFRGERGGTVLVGVEIDARKFRFEQKDGLFVDTLEVAIVALDDQVKFKAGDRHRIDLRLKPATHAAVMTEGLRLLFRLSLPPGRFQVRAAANESGSGAVGSVFSRPRGPGLRPCTAVGQRTGSDDGSGGRASNGPPRGSVAEGPTLAPDDVTDFSFRGNHYRILRGIRAGHFPLGRGCRDDRARRRREHAVQIRGEALRQLGRRRARAHCARRPVRGASGHVHAHGRGSAAERPSSVRYTRDPIRDLRRGRPIRPVRARVHIFVFLGLTFLLDSHTPQA